MAKTAEKIEFDHEGIGKTIAREHFVVPLNQREYSWEEEHVTALLEDLSGALLSGKPSYFLGTIVISKGEADDHRLEVVDGQQRLATTTIILAAIRDYLWTNGNKKRADTIRQQYLLTTDLRTEEIVPRLHLNIDDNAFFVSSIVCDPDADIRDTVPPTTASHRRLRAASTLAKTFVKNIADAVGAKDRADALIKWVELLHDRIQIVRLTVPDDLDAFLMFETLNDRGLKASQADILKNHLLRMAGTAKITEAQQKWAKMVATLESLQVDDLTVTFLRHAIICRHGPTRERELFTTVRSTLDSSPRSLSFLGQVSEEAVLYSAIFNPEHVFWNDLGGDVRSAIRTLLELRVEQIRPLVLAAMTRFDNAELRRAFKLFVSWCVRFLIAGGGRGGVLDKNYGELAQAVYGKKIKTAKDLAAKMSDVVPTDGVFEAAFREARVTQSYLARYYLRALEIQARSEPDPSFVPNAEKDVVNLEHVIPETPTKDWNLVPEVAEAYRNRLGNLALLKAKENVAAANSTPLAKAKVFKGSAFILTSEIGATIEAARKWSEIEIAGRQERLAKLALDVWGLAP